jgi:hypothetical protein
MEYRFAGRPEPALVPAPGTSAYHGHRRGAYGAHHPRTRSGIKSQEVTLSPRGLRGSPNLALVRAERWNCWRRADCRLCPAAGLGVRVDPGGVGNAVGRAAQE